MNTINSFRSKLLALTLALMASVSSFAHDFSVDGIYYNFLDDNNVEVTFKGDINYDEEYFNDIVIPQSVTYNDVTYMVTAIGREAFAECSQLTSVTFGDHVKSIGSSAFRQCTTLICVTMPIGLERIGSSAFDNCTSLASITIPNSVMNIELGAFSNTAYYNDAKNWEESVLYISNCLIEAKTSIAGDYSIKPGTRLIADYALFGCSDLTSVTFAQSVKSIGDASFYECKNMKVVNMSDSLQNIGDRAFAYCELLNPVTIPVGVKTFGTEVFMGCKSLVSIIWNAKECQDFPYFYMAPFYRISSKITSITFGDEVEYIPAGMCYGLSAVPSVTIPVNVKRIGKDAFESCASMTSITWNAEHYCDTLDYPPFEGLEYVVKSFTFGEGIETIPPYICKEMREVSEIIIPKGVKSIGRHAFNYCLGIPSVIIPEGVTTIGSAAFFHTYIESIIVPEGVTEIGGWAFSECYSLSKIELPSTLDSIGNSAFKETYYIDTLICKALVPPTMGELPVFEGIKKERTSLFVPEMSIELYQEADQWKEFYQILPIKESFENLFPTLWGLQRTSCSEYVDCQENETYLMQADEIKEINGKLYLKYGGVFLREEDSKVLIYSFPYEKDFVLYDWTLGIGDTLQILGIDPFSFPELEYAAVVDYIAYEDYDVETGDFIIKKEPLGNKRVKDISTIRLLDGNEYKAWLFGYDWEKGYYYIEGIGNANKYGGDYVDLAHPFAVPTCYYGERLVCVSRDGVLLYQIDDAEMERLGTECLCEYNNGPKKDNAKDGKIGGRPTPTQWNMLEMVVREMENNKTILQAETFSYTLEDNSRILNNKTYFDLARQSTRDTAITKSVVGALHFSEDEGNRVYFLCDGMEYLLYDFTAELGDTLDIFAGINNYPQATTYTHIVTSKDTLENGACRMMLEVVFPEETSSVENAQKVWLAGLGSLDGIVHNSTQRASNARSAETESSVMLCAWRDDECLYMINHPDFINVGCEYNHDYTAVEDVHTSGTQYKKIIRDGHLYIIHNGEIYNVLGINIAR